MKYPAGLVLCFVICCSPLLALDPLSDGHDDGGGGARETADLASALIVNTVPGFGLGSLSLDDTPGFRRGLLYDTIAWSLLGFGIAALNVDEDGPLSGPAVVSLLAGYGGYMWSRGYGIVRPLVYAPEGNGQTDGRLLAPILFNQIPGFGIGSFIQDDQTGGSVGGVLDITTFFLVGVLSGAALGGKITVSQIAGTGALVTFAAGRVWGVVRPVRYRNGTTIIQ